MSSIIAVGVTKPPSREWELGAAAGWLRGIAEQKLPESKEETPEATFTQRYTPLGACVAIVPWNYPLLLMIMKVRILCALFC